MLEKIILRNTGPAYRLAVEDLGSRLNVITGDNGLGKTFLLDCMWFALTRCWPNDVNPDLMSGYMARPIDPTEPAMLEVSCKRESHPSVYQKIKFDRPTQKWMYPETQPAEQAVVIYAQVGGGFAVWDPARNKQGNLKGKQQERQPAFVFTDREVWGGLPLRSPDKKFCNGLILDWANWQREDGESFNFLKHILDALSPSETERIVPRKTFVKLTVDDSRLIPTIGVHGDQELPVIHASAGIRRILSIAYMMVWAWTEHQLACRLTGEPERKNLVFLIDEIEAHLHPKWQRLIVMALVGAVGILNEKINVQVVTATHSPLVLAALEPHFDEARDAWYDLDLIGSGKPAVTLTRRPFERHRDVNGWLISDAFDMSSASSQEWEDLLEKASELMSEKKPDPNEFQAMNQKLLGALGVEDEFWLAWRYIGKKKGLLS